ncbi:DSBA oxidoreductase [Pseudovirgaria hyperparasitica]|uniref:DSBA oxidoreductase n=1 Tax=Pseudovirgaria hyperparasitica TaxID=470096 RepID=A0A6A6WEJ3_9PEZI|nr:DSBA oxidoreductase [Pseudovirgaria hyperparasitica]KAF2760007.1 DSBA oxidoreductase [Pseudovirgaria hyperparasitica]
MATFDIKIISDTVCPWCYVGKKRLEAGIALYKERHPDSTATFSTTWAPFFLNPAAPKESVDKQAMYESKFGVARARMMQERLSSIGASLGINFKYGGRVGNTRDSHRLVQLGKEKGAAVQTRVVEELFAAYFENERDLTDHAVLQAAGERAGLDAEEVRAWLASDQGGERVDREAREAREGEEVTGVPYFVFQGKYAIGGAEEPETFATLLEKVAAKERL